MPGRQVNPVDYAIAALQEDIETILQIVSPIPTVNAKYENFGSLVGGQQVDISGTGFFGASAVNFGSVPAPQFLVLNSTTLASAASASDRFTYTR